MPQRLPIVSGDDGSWGTILNQYLKKEHVDDGTDNAANGGHKTITVQAGTSSAGTAPIKLTSGSLMLAPEAGAIEFQDDHYFVTQTTGATRKVVAAYDDTSGATGDMYYRDASGNFLRLPVGSPAYVLTSVGGVPVWAEAQSGGGGSGGGGGLTQGQINAAIASNGIM